MRAFVSLVALLLISGCQDFSSSSFSLSVPTASTSTADSSSGIYMRFYYQDFYTLTDAGPYGCSGNMKVYYKPLESSDTLSPQPFDDLGDGTGGTEKPSFITSVSLDISDANANLGSNDSYSCSYGNGSSVPPVSNCSTFDFEEIADMYTDIASAGEPYLKTSKFDPDGAATATADGFGTGYYTMFDNACIAGGPIASSDPYISKALAGGVYIDLDRSLLEDDENLLLHITFIPLGEQNSRPTPIPTTAPYNTANFNRDESAVFKIHLSQISLSESLLNAQLQPRHRVFADTEDYPKIIDTISVLGNPNGLITQAQVFLPISMSSSIDRIRIERVSGSAILVDATLFRMGAI